MERDLEQRIKGPTSFNNLMDKIEISQNRTLKRTIRMKVGRKGNKLVLAAEWIDNQAILYIKERKNRSRAWRCARRMRAPQRVQDALKRSYISQQILTSRYVGTKKGG